jgi:hypothetical protein
MSAAEIDSSDAFRRRGHPRLTDALLPHNGAVLAITSFERGVLVASLHWPGNPQADLYLKAPSIDALLAEIDTALLSLSPPPSA